MSEEEPKEAIVKSMSEEEMASKSRLTAVYPAPAEQMSDQQLLYRMFSIFSPSSDEHAMIAFVTNYLRDNEIEHQIDSAGNILYSDLSNNFIKFFFSMFTKYLSVTLSSNHSPSFNLS